MPAHDRIDDNETADALVKEARKLNKDKVPRVVILTDVNAVGKSRLKDKVVKHSHQICELDTRTNPQTLLPDLEHATLEGRKSTEMKLQSNCTVETMIYTQSCHLSIFSPVLQFWSSYNRLVTVHKKVFTRTFAMLLLPSVLILCLIDLFSITR